MCFGTPIVNVGDGWVGGNRSPLLKDPEDVGMKPVAGVGHQSIQGEERGHVRAIVRWSLRCADEDRAPHGYKT